MIAPATHPRPKLTIGMACYDDFDGVYFSVQALQLYHAEAMENVELLVVDNHPDGPEGKTVCEFLTSWGPRSRYIAAPDAIGTAAPRELVFREAAGEAVLCIDSHVMLAPGALSHLLAYYDAHPQSRDLLAGPMLYDDCRSVSTHMDPQWRSAFFGVWASDPRGQDADGPPFEIPMHGCGLMSCRKDAWPGFNPEFRAFGGEEGYIHEKFRQRGGKVLCLPRLRWLHRFYRPHGVSYPLNLEGKVRNYLLGRIELGLPYDDVLDHFGPLMPRANVEEILRQLGLPSISECLFKSARRAAALEPATAV